MHQNNNNQQCISIYLALTQKNIFSGFLPFTQVLYDATLHVPATNNNDSLVNIVAALKLKCK